MSAGQLRDVYAFLSRTDDFVDNDCNAIRALAQCDGVNAAFIFAAVLPAAFVVGPERHAYHEWFRPRVRQNIANRKRSTAFVLHWLSQGQQARVPSLHDLCVQRIAYSLLSDAITLQFVYQDKEPLLIDKIALVSAIQTMVRKECDLHEFPPDQLLRPSQSPTTKDYDCYDTLACSIVDEILCALIVRELYRDLRECWRYDISSVCRDVLFIPEFDHARWSFTTTMGGDSEANWLQRRLPTEADWLQRRLPYLSRMIHSKGRGCLAATVMLSSSIAEGVSKTWDRSSHGGVVLAVFAVLRRVGSHPLDYLALYPVHTLLGYVRYNAAATDRTAIRGIRSQLNWLRTINEITYKPTPYNEAAINLLFGNTPQTTRRLLQQYGRQPLAGTTTARNVFDVHGFTVTAVPTVKHLLRECHYYVSGGYYSPEVMCEGPLFHRLNTTLSPLALAIEKAATFQDKNAYPCPASYPNMSKRCKLALRGDPSRERLLVEAFVSPQVVLLDLRDNKTVTDIDLSLALMGMPNVSTVFTRGASQLGTSSIVALPHDIVMREVPIDLERRWSGQRNVRRRLF